jgi:Protein of unknown function (DUF1570).
MYKSICCLVLLVFSCGASAAPEQWIEIHSDHFTLFSDAGEKQGRHTLDQFERMRWLFQTLFASANVDPAEPIVIIATRNEKGFKTLEPADYLKKGALNLGGYFFKSPDKNYILLRLDVNFEHPFEHVYHEYTHLQLAADGEWMPLWINEGLAEFFQNTEIRNKDVVLGEASAYDILYLRENQLIPLPTLLRVDRNSPYYHEDSKGSVFYAESWVLTHYLMITDSVNHVHRLPDYLKYVKNNDDPVVAAQKAFGDLGRLELELKNYIRASQYKAFLISSAASPIDETSFRVRPLSDIDTQAVKADLLAYIKRTDEARSLLDAVLTADPNNVQALETKAFLAYQDGDIDDARKWYGQAVKLNSQNFLAYYHYAALSLNQPDAEENNEIEVDLRAAIRLNPRFAPAYDMLASCLAMHHAKLEEAHRMNVIALHFDPTNFYYRLNTANVLLAAQRYTDALTVLKDAQKIAKSPQEMSMLQSRIDEIQSSQAERAKIEAEAKAQTEAPPVRIEIAIDAKPKYPTMPVVGPKHLFDGVIRGVSCRLPATLEFRVVKPGKSVWLYTNNYYKLDLSVLNFDPPDSMNPCTDFEGMKAKVEYIDSSDKAVDGQIVSVELRK